MSLLGSVFNKALGRSINVYLAKEGSGYIRLTDVIDDAVKRAALNKTMAAFESGKLFNENDMKNMEQLTITNMGHPSDNDPNNHY
ncbi:hypothetical protein MMC12_000056 [Toensbergia leucococca]|nr:hypothetical protein [Toensbergia leucococca]